MELLFRWLFYNQSDNVGFEIVRSLVRVFIRLDSLADSLVNLRGGVITDADMEIIEESLGDCHKAIKAEYDHTNEKLKGAIEQIGVTR